MSAHALIGGSLLVILLILRPDIGRGYAQENKREVISNYSRSNALSAERDSRPYGRDVAVVETPPPRIWNQPPETFGLGPEPKL